MKKINIPMPEKAKAVVKEVAEREMYSMSFYMYLSMCCANEGYFNAAKYFAGEAREEMSHFSTLAKYMQDRGEEMDVPKVDAPKINFTDLKSGIKAAAELMVEVTQMYDEAIRVAISIDILTCNALMPFLDIQTKALGYYNDAMSVFGELKSKEEQLEQDRFFFWTPTDQPMATNP